MISEVAEHTLALFNNISLAGCKRIERLSASFVACAVMIVDVRVGRYQADAPRQRTQVIFRAPLVEIDLADTKRTHANIC
jgi:hypothetical protein